MLSDLIDYNKASDLLRVSKPTLHAYIKAGKLTKHHVVNGGNPFPSMHEIEGMMKKSRRINSNLTVKYFRRTENDNAAKNAPYSEPEKRNPVYLVDKQGFLF